VNYAVLAQRGSVVVEDPALVDHALLADRSVRQYPGNRPLDGQDRGLGSEPATPQAQPASRAQPQEELKIIFPHICSYAFAVTTSRHGSLYSRPANRKEEGEGKKGGREGWHQRNRRHHGMLPVVQQPSLETICFATAKTFSFSCVTWFPKQHFM
jgi:hypothetical protein